MAAPPPPPPTLPISAGAVSSLTAMLASVHASLISQTSTLSSTREPEPADPMPAPSSAADAVKDSSLLPPETLHNILLTIQSPLPLPNLASSLVAAIHSALLPTKGELSPDAEVSLQSDLFSILGDENMPVMFDLFSLAPRIFEAAQALSPGTFAELSSSAGESAAAPGPGDDAASALYAAQLARQELSGLSSSPPPAPLPRTPQLVGVTVKRASDRGLRKAQKAYKKQQAQAKAQLAPLAASEDYLAALGFDPEHLRTERELGLQGGGFRGKGDGHVREMVNKLKPEGTKQ